MSKADEMVMVTVELSRHQWKLLAKRIDISIEHFKENEGDWKVAAVKGEELKAWNGLLFEIIEATAEQSMLFSDNDHPDQVNAKGL